MKAKIFISTLILLLISTVALPQFVDQSIGGNPGVRNSVGGAFKAKLGLVFTEYPDTLTPNLNANIVAENGFAIKVGDAAYLRDTLHHKWIKFESLSTPGSHVDSVTITVDSTQYILWQGGTTLYFPSLLRKVLPGLNTFFTWQGSSLVINSSGSVAGAGSRLLQGGYVTHNTGYTYDVTAAIYNIGTGLYTSSSGSITLATADTTFDRLDLIGLDTSGAIIKVTGVASANPQLPQVNPLTQLALTSVLVKAGTTAPDNITRVIVYDENTEWSHTATLTPGFNDLINPFHLTKAINIASWTTSPVSAITFTSPVKLNISDYNVLKFFISLKAVLPSNAFIFVALMNGTTYVTPYTPITTAFGLNSATSAYQNISVPFSALTITGTQWDRVQFYLYGLGPGMYLDYVQFQGGISNGNSQYGPVYKKTGTDSIFQNLNGVPDFRYKDSTGGASTIPTLQQVLDVQHANAVLNKADTITLNGNQLNIGDASAGYLNGIELSPGQTVINAAYATTGDYAKLNINASPGGQLFNLTTSNGVGGSTQASITGVTDPTTSQISIEASDLRLRSTLVGAANGYVWTLSDNSTGTGSWQPASGGGGSIVSVTGDLVDNTDPLNPVVGLGGTHTLTSNAILEIGSRTLDVASTFASRPSGLLRIKGTGGVYLGDWNGDVNNTSIVIEDGDQFIKYTAAAGHTFVGSIINNADSSTSPFNVVTIDENNVWKRAAIPRLDTAYRSADSLSLIFSYLGGAKDSFQFSGGITKIYAGGHLANTNDSTLNADSMAVNIYTSLASKVTSVSGAANRITSTGGTSPVIDISASYIGQSSITTLGTITTGTWNGTPVATTYGGAGSGGTTGQVLTKNSNTNYDYSWATPSSLLGTANRITISSGVVDISAAYVGQTSITTLGTIGTGTWNGTPIASTYGGTVIGGTTGQVLTKNSNTNYDYSWATPTGGGGTGISRILAGYGETLVNDSTTNVDSSVILNRARAVNEYLPIIGRTYTTTAGVGLNLTTSTLTSGNLVSFYSSGTAAASNNQTLVADSTYGANGTSAQTTYAHRIYNVHTGTTATNVGLLVSASGGTNNYALIVPNGNVGIGNSAPSSSFKLDVTGGIRAASGGGVSYAIDQGSAIRGDGSTTQWYLDGNGSLAGQISVRSTTFVVSASQTTTNLTSQNYVSVPFLGGSFRMATVDVIAAKQDSTILRINDNQGVIPKIGMSAKTILVSDTAGVSVQDWAEPRNAAIMEWRSHGKFILPPRMTSAERDAVVLTGAGPGHWTGTGGSGYTTGTYGVVALTGGTGTGATAKVVVSGGTVLRFSLVSYGSGFTIGDVLTPSGIGAGSGFSYTLDGLTGDPGLTFFCRNCTATDGSTGVDQTWNGTTWKNAW